MMKNINQRRVPKIIIRTMGAGFVFCLFAANAFAAVFNVSVNDPNCSDTTGAPYCKIQAAIHAANENDTIQIAAGTYNEHLVIYQKSLQLVGADKATTIVRGYQTAPVVTLINVSPKNIHLSSLTLTNGKSSNGGGIWSKLAHLTLFDCDVTNNKASARGGGLYVDAGDLTLDSSRIEGNIADDDAGAVLHMGSGNVLIQHSSFNNNEAVTGSMGAIGNFAGTLAIENSEISNNIAGSAGGGVYQATLSEVSIKKSVLKNNVATDSGGALLSGGKVTIEGSEFSDNFAATGGAAILFRGATIYQTKFIHNQTTNDAGALFHGSTSALILNETTFSQNLAGNNGGAIVNNSGTLKITNSTINDNESKDTGGGIYNKATLNLINTTISGNLARNDAGGIYNEGNATLRSTTVVNNRADSDNNGSGAGGGFLNDGVLTIKNSIAAGNFKGPSQASDCAGTIFSEGYNLIETANCPIDGLTTGNVINLAAHLDALGDNGGFTQTHSLAANSPAIDGGDPAGCTDADGNILTMDQRGATRSQGSACDIGAFEVGCGDGVVSGGEECDDGNTDNEDGCSAICNIESATVPITPTNEETTACADGTVSSSCADGAVDKDDSVAPNGGASGGGCSLNENQAPTQSVLVFMWLLMVGVVVKMRRI